MAKNKNENVNSTDLAGRTYEVRDYKAEDTLSSGLATSHEQVSDAYMEGEIKAVIDHVDGKVITIERKGFDKEAE
ncbi:YozQ family protein [Metabacillus litoralis]|uniref:YozQ family protein n=1 Tax=Metabacillus litoralis TaxID=152268 RepID=UPI001CFCD8D9|nr:YozQ family protein [Metabacillus litoralis]